MAEPLHPPPNTTTTDLPTEILLFNILPRLPAKSILRFKFLCKQWHSHLTTPSFAKTHLHHLTNNHHQNHHKLIVLSLSKSEPFNFCTMDCETPKHPLTPTRLMPFKATYETMSIVTSFHGMLCVGIATNRSSLEYSHLILWNPLTGEYKMLSKLHGSDHKECYSIDKSPFRLYYTSSDDDYMLLRVTNYHAAYIYSLKSDSWRKVVVEREAYHDNNYDWFSYTREPTALLNDKLYFLKQRVMFGFRVPKSYSILMFDTKTEKFTVIAAPCFGNQLTTCSGFMVHRDRIHLCVTTQIAKDRVIIPENIEFWRMDEDGDWTKVLNYQPMSMCLWYKYPLHLMRNGNWLMYSVYFGVKGGVVQLDLDTQTTDEVGPNIYVPLRGKYMETIVSPNQYTK